jgi:O-antigen ligase
MSRILPNISFSLLAALLLFAPLARGSVHGWAIGIIFLTVLAAAALYLAANIWQGSLRWIKTPLDYPILALVCLTLLSYLFSVHRPTSLLATLQLFSCIVFYYLVIHTVNSRSRIKQLVYILLGISVFLAIFGLVKSAGLNPFPWWEYPHQANVTYLSSTFGNRNHLAGWMEMSIALVLGFVIFQQKSRWKTISLALLLLLLAALVFSQSRGGWFGMLAAFMCMSFLLYRSKRLITSRWAVIVVNAAFVVAFIVVSSTPVTDRLLTAEAGFNDGSLAGRINAWHGVVDLARANPLLGTGPGTFAVTFPKYQPPGFQANLVYAHNDYLDFTAELGFGLLIIIAWMIVALYRQGLHKMRSKSKLTRGVTLGALAGITAILVHSFVDFNLQIPANAMLFTVLAALAAAPRVKRVENSYKI